jgi:hypothetical protein
MDSPVCDPIIDVHELQRLENLLPDPLRSRVIVVQSVKAQSVKAQSVKARSVKANSVLIATEKIAKNRFSVAISLADWQQFSEDQRDLLFWHEAARIFNKTIKRFEWEIAVVGAGLSVSLLEIASQNLLSLSISLSVVGLASYQLYQRKWGEQGLRGITSADQGAIDLAIQFGYSFSQAANSLKNALEILSKQAPHQSLWKKYQVRLSVLEMLIARRRESSQKPLLVTPALFNRPSSSESCT